MRVFYPVSARFSDFVNDGTGVSSGWMMVWSVFCILLMMLVLSVLPSYEAGAANKQHGYFSDTHLNRAVHISGIPAKQNIGEVQWGKHISETAGSKRVSTQDYIDAHRCARYAACLDPIKSNLLAAVPARPRAGVDRHL